MLIKQKSIRSADRFLKALLPSNKVRLVVAISDENKVLAQKAGFTKNPDAGDTILPTDIGNTSRFNSEGKYKLLKDLPKEERYLYTVEWTWTQWCGRGQCWLTNFPHFPHLSCIGMHYRNFLNG